MDSRSPFASASAAVHPGAAAPALAPAHVHAPDPDLALVQQVQEGHLEAFDLLVRKYRERVLSILYNMTSNREDAADLAQDTFIKAFTSISRFKGKSTFFTWLYRIAVNTGLTHLQRHRNRRFFSFEKMSEDAQEQKVLDHLSSASGADKPTLLAELQEKLNEALQTLSDNHRTVVILFEIQGLTHGEIAEVLGCSEGTVRSRLHYAKQQLQSILQGYLNK